jgi:hypothetical protein
MQSKPFFLPWSKTPHAYDSLLGISITLLDNTIDKVFLSKYRKTQNEISAVFTRENGEIIASVHNYLDTGIQTINIPPTDKLLSGSITVIDSVSDEIYESPVQISPLFVYYSDTQEDNSRLSVNGEYINLQDAQLIFSEEIAEVIYQDTQDNKVEAHIKFLDTGLPTLGENTIDGITVFAGEPVVSDTLNKKATGTLRLPGGFNIKKINDRFALISPYSYETCYTSPYTGDTLSTISCNVSKSEDNPRPLDICFDYIEDKSNGYVEKKFILNPQRIDTLKVPGGSGIGYLELNAQHDISDGGK